MSTPKTAAVETGHVARPFPIYVKVKKGQKYFWCACGLSKNQPWCDGSHKGTNFKPVQYMPENDCNARLCMCKQTKTSPLCDLSHVKVLQRSYGKPALALVAAVGAFLFSQYRHTWSSAPPKGTEKK